MIKNYYSIILSLSGMCQSIAIVHQLSQTGQCHDKSFNVCIDSILNINSTAVLSIYGNKERNLELGIKTLLSLLNTNLAFEYSINSTLIRYIISIVRLEKKLKQNNIYNQILLEKLLKIIKKNSYLEYKYDLLTDWLAEIYINTISKLGSRIHISGSQKILKNLLIQNKIRCALLAGIRSATLWKQLGGSFFQLWFYKNKINEQAEYLLKKINNKTDI